MYFLGEGASYLARYLKGGLKGAVVKLRGLKGLLKRRSDLDDNDDGRGGVAGVTGVAGVLSLVLWILDEIYCPAHGESGRSSVAFIFIPGASKQVDRHVIEVLCGTWLRLVCVCVLH